MTTNQTRPPESARHDGIQICGTGWESVSAILASSLEVELVEKRLQFDCTSGRTISASWLGVPLLELVETATGIPGETTHLVLTSSDGQTACISIAEAQGGLLATESNGDRLEAPRFVASGIAGPRAVKAVESIDPVTLEAHESRDEYESLTERMDEDGDVSS